MAVDTLTKLDFVDIDAGDNETLVEWYALYKKSFPHPGEQEPLAAFKDILRMNGDAGLQSKFGPYREYLIAIRDPASGKIIGGLNFGVTTSPDHVDAGFMASVQAIFLFVDMRGRLTPRRVMHEINRRAVTAFDYAERRDGGDIAIFFEANDPLAMSEQERREDVDFSGTDPFRRYKGWLDVGASPLDFDYVQPALDDEKHPVDILDLFYLGKGRSISPKMLQRHLYSFISISVLKGKDAEDNAEYRGMIAELSGMQVMPLLNREESRKLIEIERKAKEIRAAQARPRQLECFPVQRLQDSARRRRRSYLNTFGWLGLDRLYQIGYALYHFMEGQHDWMIMFELVVGSVALLLTIVSINLRSAGQWQLAHMSEWLDSAIIIVLSIYVVVQGVVRRRRSRLGNRFNLLWNELGIGDVLRPGDSDAAHGWFNNQLIQRLARVNDYGPVSNSTEWETERTRWLSTISDFASSVYSDRRIFGAVDLSWRQQDMELLDKAIQAFPDGLWSFRMDDNPEQVFCNIVVPIRPPTRPGQIDLNHLEIDHEVAAFLSGQITPLPHGETSHGPYLLILRQLAIAPGGSQRHAPEIEQQFGLILTMLLRIGMMVERLSGSAGIRRGVPRHCTVLSVSASEDSAKLFRWLGFSLLQRPPAHGSVGATHGLAQSNLSLYGMVLGGNDEKAQRLRDLMVLLNAARHRFGGR